MGGQTWWDLQAALDRGGWHIFHFIGHGDFDTHSGEGVLGLAGEDGGVHRLAASDLALLLQEHHSLRLVVLNSCDTARASATDRFSSTASVLMRRGIPAVAAMQYEISDAAAIAFARGFYTALAAQHPVDQAVTRARQSIKLSRRNTLEWATPVLYLRSATGALFDLTDIPATPHPRRQTHGNQTSEPTRPPLRRHLPPPEEPSAPAARPSSQVPPAPSKRLETRLPRLTRLSHDDRVRGGGVQPGRDPAGHRQRRRCTAPDLGPRHRPAAGPAVPRRRGACGGVQPGRDPAGHRQRRTGTARIWDPATGQQLARLADHDSGVGGGVQPGRDPAGHRQQRIDGARIWDPATGQQLAGLGPTGAAARCMRWRSARTGPGWPPAAATGTARIWDLATGQQLARLAHDGRGALRWRSARTGPGWPPAATAGRARPGSGTRPPVSG